MKQKCCFRLQLPFELTSRYMGAYLEVNSLDCNYYIDQAVTDTDRQTSICANYDFTKLDDVKAFLRPTYYGGDYLTEF